MPGILDFLGLGGQQEAPPQQGLTNPDLYNQAPPEFKLPFAYKLAMLGSSINRSYGGQGGMDVGGLAKAYLENQQTQYDWQTEQAERKRKLDLVRKYAEKSGNTELMDLFEADPDAAIKYVFGVEQEKAKGQEPKVVGDYLIDPTGKVLFQPPARDLSWLEGGGTPAAAPDTAAAAPPPDAVPSTGAARTATGDIAPNAAPVAPTVQIPATAPVTTAPAPVSGLDLTDLSKPTVASIQTIQSNLDKSLKALDKQRQDIIRLAPGMDSKDIGKSLLDIQAERDKITNEAHDDMLAQAAEDRKAKAAVKAAEVAAETERKELPVSAKELEYRNTLTPDQQTAYDNLRSEPSSAEKQYAYLKTLKTDEERQAFMSVLRAPAAQAADPFDTARAKDISTQWSKYTEAAGNAQGVAADLAGMQELIKSGTLAQGVMRDPMALASSIFPWVTDPSATFASYINSVAPRMRVEGSGATSDKDYDRFVMAMPSVLNNPKANAAITSVLLARYQLIMDRAAIVDQIDDGVLSKSEGRKALRELNSRKIIPDEVKAVIDDAIKNNPKLLKQQEAEAPGGSSRINSLLDEIEGAEEP